MALSMKRLQLLTLLIGVEASKMQQGAGQAQKVWLQGNRTADGLLQADPRDWRPFCIYPGKADGGFLVKVFVGADNSRKLSFGEHDLGTQSEVICKNEPSGPCASETRATLLSATPTCEQHSCACEQDTSLLKLEYMREMMGIVLPVCQTMSSGVRALVVGLGGGALTNYILAHCPDGTKVETIESDARVAEVATKMFGLQFQPGVSELEIQDGGKALQQRIDKGLQSVYDFIIMDCLVAGDKVPESCRSQGTIAAASKLLRPQGKVIQHVWKPQLVELETVFKKQFGNSFRLLPVDNTEINFVLVGSTLIS